MRIRFKMLVCFLWVSQFSMAQSNGNPPLVKTARDSGAHFIFDLGEIPKTDSAPTVNFREVNIVTFKSAEEWNKYYTYKSRILTVMPYVKVAKQLYTELQEKEDTSRRRDYRRYRRELEKEMRGKFEKDLKDLTTGQGEMLFKLINRETGNNCYKIIKELKGPLPAWFYQTVAKRWGYDLKETYDPDREKMIELIIKELGPNYKVI
jgi:hypothetical protein